MKRLEVFRSVLQALKASRRLCWDAFQHKPTVPRPVNLSHTALGEIGTTTRRARKLHLPFVLSVTIRAQSEARTNSASIRANIRRPSGFPVGQ